MEALQVRLGNVVVGLLERFDDEEYRFSFDAGWLADPRRSVLGQFFEDRKYEDIRTSGMPCWFAHLLPQGLHRRFVEHVLGFEDRDDFQLLAALGDDLPGAVVVKQIEPSFSRGLRGRTERPAAPDGGLRFSLAGAQVKLSVRDGERGLTVPVRGETGRWIAKFHDPSYPGLPRIEASTLEWARRAGILVPESRLATVAEFSDLPAGTPIGDGSVLLIKRFDRLSHDERVHMEDFAQILDRPPGHSQYRGKYEEIAAVLKWVAPSSIEAFVRALVFTLLSGNTDAHLKNWSIVYPDGRTPQLSPSYDQVSTVHFVPPLEDAMALSLAEGRRYEDVSIDAFSGIVAAAGIDEEVVLGWVRDQVALTLASFRTAPDVLGFSPEQRERIEAHLLRMPLSRFK